MQNLQRKAREAEAKELNTPKVERIAKIPQIACKVSEVRKQTFWSWRKMLLDITVKNVLSFGRPTSLNLMTGYEHRFSDTLPLLKQRYNRKVNPVAALFGANASGKSNLVKVLEKCRRIMIPAERGKERRLPFEPFQLDEASASSPSEIELLFELNDYIYEYSIAYNATEIVEEKLELYLSRNSRVLFQRRDGKVWLEGAADPIGEPDNALSALAYTVPDDETLVTHVAEAKTKHLSEKLQEKIRHMISPYFFVQRMVFVDADISSSTRFFTNTKANWESAMPEIDAGIVGTEANDVDPSAMEIDDDLLQEIKAQCERGEALDIETTAGRFRVEYDEGGLKVREVQLLHQGQGNSSTTLPWSAESAGTKSASRLFTLFGELQRPGSTMILVVDELDRSFHTELSKALIDGFLQTRTKESRAQLIFTTHDLLLMDPARFRKDQIWIVEKGSEGATELTPLSDYADIRSDKDLRKTYLEGRFGGVPDIQPLHLSFEGMHF